MFDFFSLSFVLTTKLRYKENGFSSSFVFFLYFFDSSTWKIFIVMGHGILCYGGNSKFWREIVSCSLWCPEDGYLFGSFVVSDGLFIDFFRLRTLWFLIGHVIIWIERKVVGLFLRFLSQVGVLNWRWCGEA